MSAERDDRDSLGPDTHPGTSLRAVVREGLDALLAELTEEVQATTDALRRQKSEPPPRDG